MNIISQIVGRDCHVGKSDTAVIRHVISRLKNKRATFWAMSKDDRRYLMQTAIDCHHENQGLYDFVMGSH